jgi:hypothetical protein
MNENSSTDSELFLRDMRWIGRQVVLHTDGVLCSSTQEVVTSRAFERVFNLFLDYLEDHEDPLLESLITGHRSGQERKLLLMLIRAMADIPLEYAVRSIPGTEAYIAASGTLYLFVESFYDFWRSFDRFLVCHSEHGPRSHDKRPYRTFNATVERLEDLTRALYRDICENITGDHVRIYRQLHAGCNVGVIAVHKEWPRRDESSECLTEIPIIRQVLIHPPLIMDPPENRRTGSFKRVDINPLEGIDLDPADWLCYPARVGPIVVFVYFHQRFIGLGCSLANLFELATDEQVFAGPDAIYLFGVDPAHMKQYGELPTVFYDDETRDLLIAAVPGEDHYGYFGYLKKMILTLHNIRMMKKGLMPFHGAMSRIVLRNGKAANLLIIGDTATGKSESLEALRTLGEETISRLTVVADDMGSLEVAGDIGVVGYGTETGAFIRLDDLEHGYAFNQVDRAIIMSPQKANARVVLPVTTIKEVLAGHRVDMILYANNYEQVDDEHPVIERFNTMEEALDTFRTGTAMSKGTTTSTGLTTCYFANIFGPDQYRELHEALATKVFKAAFDSNILVGQIRTRLGVEGFEKEGPKEAARVLLALISEKGESS